MNIENTPAISYVSELYEIGGKKKMCEGSRGENWLLEIGLYCLM